LITESVIGASGIIFGVILLLLAFSGTVDKIAKLFTQPLSEEFSLRWPRLPEKRVSDRGRICFLTV